MERRKSSVPQTKHIVGEKSESIKFAQFFKLSVKESDTGLVPY